jgi:hypothetical protein
LPPPQQQPQALPSTPQAGPSPAQQASLLLVLAAVEANTDSLLVSRTEPQCGHFVPRQSLERTRISLSLSHLSQ